MNAASRNRKAQASVLLVALALLCSCSPKRPETLTRLIASSDRVVASDPYAGYRITLTGDQARRLVAGLSSAERDKNCYSAVFGCQIGFYRGSNLLATIRCQDRAFLTANEQFSEGTGTLREFQRGWESDETGAQNWINDLAEDVRRNPSLSSLQSWALELMERVRNGQVSARPGLTYKYPEVDEKDLPEWIRTAFRGWEVYVIPESSGKPHCVMLNYHCMAGVLAGPSDYAMDFPAWYSTNVTPGIYAYRVSQP
jgi:hypothetical protein